MTRRDATLVPVVDSEETDNINNSNCIIIIRSSTATTSDGDTFLTPYDGQSPLQRDVVSPGDGRDSFYHSSLS